MLRSLTARRRVAAVASVALTAALVPLVATTPTATALSPDIVVSQVYGGGGNTGAPFTNDFVELFNRGAAPVSLAGWSVQYASATGTGNFAANGALLTGTLQPGQYHLVQMGAGAGAGVPLPTPDTVGTTAMSGTAGKVAVARTTTSLGCNGGSTPCTPDQSAQIVDLVGYGNANFFEGAAAAPTLSNTTAALRGDGGCVETDQNGTDFTAAAPDPRTTATALAPCGGPPGDAAPTVAAVAPADGAVNVDIDAAVDVTFSEPVSINSDWFTLVCSSSGAHPGTTEGTGTSFTIDPDTDFAGGETCTLTIAASTVTDDDTTDPPDNMAADFSTSFSTALVDPCTAPITPIPAIQGSGATAAITGLVTIRGIVVSDDEGPAGTLRGFNIQDPAGDDDPATSDAIFVFNGGANVVQNGDEVVVLGRAAEFERQTQITRVSSITACGTGTVPPTDVSLPVASATFLERYEHMLVRFPQTLTVTEHFELARFGQVVLSSGGRLRQPTNVVLPGAPAIALQAANNLNRIVLDDNLIVQNPDPIRLGRGGNPLSASNTLRAGDTLTGAVGVLGEAFGTYRIQPFNALGGGAPQFAATNPRPDEPPDVGGSIQVVGMNVLNYFNTFNPGCRAGVAGPLVDCRGADDAAEFERQIPKTVAAILGTGAEVIGLNEVENDGYGPDSAVAQLVGALNAATAPGTWAYIDADAGTGQINSLGTDAIRVALIYQPAAVTPVGQTAVLNTVAFVNGGDPAPRSRPALAQAFRQNKGGGVFTAVVNHLKSKGSPCTAPDAGDGQGNCNTVRLNAVNELIAWLATDPAGTGDPDLVLVGDLNAYAKEDPIRALEDAGYTNLVEQFLGADAYSYIFGAQSGYLDHALASSTMVSQVSGVGEWHINADEPPALDYNTNFKSAGLIESLYAPDQFRTSDHDPAIVGLDLAPQAPVVGPVSGPTAPVAVGAAVDVSAPFTDVGGETHTATIDWGDGTSTPGTVVDDADGGSVSGSHTYAADGVYTVTVTVVAASGAAGSATLSGLVVFDPDSIVAGVGLITSPAGSLTSPPAARGPALFVLAAGYAQGATTPPSLFSLQFPAGRFSVNATSSRWLLVDGTTARLAGTARVNGVDGYDFEVTATDGRPDQLRVVVRDSAASVVYDSGLRTVTGVVTVRD